MVMSKRKKDDNGFIEIKDNPISRSGTFKYLGSEIGGPDPNKIYIVYRAPEQLNNQKTIDSFKLIPWVDDHEMLGEDNTPAEDKGVQGVVGENVYYDHPYLKANIKIFGEKMKNKNESGKIDLSPGIFCEYIFEPGTTPEGENYDVKQVDIIANHLALVDEGRSGKAVATLDSFTINLKGKVMEDDILSKLDDILARVEKLEGGQSDLKNEHQEIETEIAEDEDAEQEEKDLEKKEEGEDEKAEEEAAEDEDAEEEAAEDEKAKDSCGGKAMDDIKALKKELSSVKKSLKKMKIAMDAQSAKSKKLALVSKIEAKIGAFDHASMSYDQVVQHGLKALGVKASKAGAAIALDAALQLCSGQEKRKIIVRQANDKSVASYDTNKIFGSN